MKIRDILEKIDENQLFVPAFQREYVWKREDAKQLVDSLVKEYPTGTMLTWETSSPPELKGHHKYHESQGAVKLLLDGQQRVTTLYMLIRGTLPPYYKESEIMNDTRGLYMNLESQELSYYTKTKMENNPLWQNITDVFDRKVRVRDITRGLEARDEEVSREREDLIDDNIRALENILDRQFPEQTIPIKASVREAIDIFYKVNDGGVALTEAELALAQISGYWPEARDTIKARLSSLAEGGFVLKLDFMVYVLLGCVHYNGSEMKKLHGPENKEAIRETWERLDSDVLDYVFNMLRSQAYLDHTSELSSVYALIPIIVYCFQKKGGHPSDQEIRKMVKWLYYSQIRRHYVSQLPQKLDRDLRRVKESESPFDELLQAIADETPLEVRPLEFEGHGISHPLFNMMRFLHKSRGAVCFTTGVTLRQNMGAKYQLENDHIFPYSRLKKAGFDQKNRIKYALAQELTNRAILTQVANRKKSATSAEDYLTDVSTRFPQALGLQSIPKDAELWKLENYEDFLRKRRQMLADEINQFLESITQNSEVIVPMSIEALIASGESAELEFKSSLRWDPRLGTVNKKLQDVIIKTVAAFSNAEGGTLLIGVEDDQTILGLERDYSSLKGDRDEFELHLRNLLNKSFNKAFATSRLDIGFHNFGSEEDPLEICRIDIKEGTVPVFLTLKDKNGQPSEKFYVRSGNSSQELSMSELGDYLRDRFES